MTQGAPESHGVRPDTAHALLHRVAAAQAEGRAPSSASGVVRDGRLVWSAGRGEVGGETPTADTQYRIGSITKTFTAVQIMKLRDEGVLGLDDRVDAHVPDTELGDRTIRALLSHTAGLAAEPPGAWWERIPGPAWPKLARGFTRDLVLEPGGGRFHYSNPGYALLGRVVETHRGCSWYEALRTDVLDPLGMTRTTYAAEQPAADGFAVHPWADLLLPEPPQDTGAMSPAGVLWSTVNDLARWMTFLAGDTADVLSADTVAEMRRMRAVADGAEWVTAYGLGLQIFRIGGREYIGHGGSLPGFIGMIALDLGRRTGGVILTNTTSGYPLSAHELVEIVEQHEPAIAPAWSPSATVSAGILEILGIWHWGPAPYSLRLRPDGLLELAPLAGRGRASSFRRADGTGGGESALWVGTENYFDGEPLTVVRRHDGSVSHLDIGTFVFTREPYGPDEPVPGGLDPDGWRPGSE